MIINTKPSITSILIIAFTLILNLSWAENDSLGKSGKLKATIFAPDSFVPFSAKKEGRIGNYFMGMWPFEKKPTLSSAYANPVGFIEITLGNMNQFISEHFRLRDFVDNNQSGWTDDINHDGRVDIGDAKIIAQAAERVEAKYPKLIGGIGIYPGNGAHGPFIHVDVRGQAARWNG